jgi:hypothetical protein
VIPSYRIGKDKRGSICFSSSDLEKFLQPEGDLRKNEPNSKRPWGSRSVPLLGLHGTLRSFGLAGRPDKESFSGGKISITVSLSNVLDLHVFIGL